MSSGVKVHESVDEYVQKMLMPSKGAKDDRLKIVIMRLNEKKDSIIVDEENTKYLKDFKDSDDVFKEVMKLFKKEQCCYAVYDCFYETKDCSGKEELVFISWCPDDASLRDKMIYGASTNGVKGRFPSIKHHLQMNDSGDKTSDGVLDKLGKGRVVQLEGRPI